MWADQSKRARHGYWFFVEICCTGFREWFMTHKYSSEQIVSFTCVSCNEKWSVSEFKGYVWGFPYCEVIAIHHQITKELTHVNCGKCSDWISFKGKIDGELACTHCGVKGKLERKEKW